MNLGISSSLNDSMGSPSANLKCLWDPVTQASKSRTVP